MQRRVLFGLLLGIVALVTCPAASFAGSYQLVSQSGGTLTVTGPPAPYNSKPFTGPGSVSSFTGTSTGTSSGKATVSGTVVSVFAWVPTGTEPVPDRVDITESCTVSASGTAYPSSGQSVGSGHSQADNGIGGSTQSSTISIYAAGPGSPVIGYHYGSTSSSTRTSYLAGGQTIIVVASPTAEVEVSAGPVSVAATYGVSVAPGHAHPYDFRNILAKDISNGELEMKYEWKSTSGNISDLNGIAYEYISSYSGDGQQQTHLDGSTWFHPAYPPFFAEHRSPLDGSVSTGSGSTQPALLSTGFLVDTHRRPSLHIPMPWAIDSTRWDNLEHNFTRSYTGHQVYRFRCNTCNKDDIIPGPDGGNHTITRTFAPEDPWQACNHMDRRWRYTVQKDSYSAWILLNESHYLLEDSSGVIW